MKYLNLIIIALMLLFGSCNRHEEPQLEVKVAIIDTYLPVSWEYNAKDITQEQKKNIFHLVNNDHVVNDVSELPDDPMGFSDAVRSINYKEYTLLVKYVLHDWKIDTYSNRYYRNTKENSYNWSINVGTSSDIDVDSDEETLTRFAIKVKKLPPDAVFKSWFGLYSIGSFPE